MPSDGTFVDVLPWLVEGEQDTTVMTFCSAMLRLASLTQVAARVGRFYRCDPKKDDLAALLCIGRRERIRVVR